MKKVVKLTAIPENSAVLDGFGEVHFHDTYQIAVRTDKPAAEVAKEMTKLPAWATALFRLRNAIVGIFGLKADSSDTSFPVISEREEEVVSGLEDSHLDFRASILKDQTAGTISLTTVVQFNNVWGRVYFFPVKPFHKIIMRALLRRYLKSCR
jgi:predicted mannosyl-3-phosphoglycerate phosphatase (HAD superfamily)